LGEEKEKKKRWGEGEAFFPGPEAGHTLLAEPHGIFMAVKYN
jgi:hypothetical protein